MINRFALSFLCIELDMNVRFGVMLVYILLLYCIVLYCIVLYCIVLYCIVPRSKLKRHGDRSFNVVEPVLWNSLPECMKSSSSVAYFKRTLKTFLFRQEYGVIN